MENVMVSAAPQPDSRVEKEKLIQLAKRILKSDSELKFLLRLETEELPVCGSGWNQTTGNCFLFRRPAYILIS